MLFILPTNTCFWIWCYINDLENYKNIYKIKNRAIDKPLAIFVKDFDYFEKNTNLSKKKIDFLKNYDKPFTVLIDKKDCKDDYLLKNIEKLPNAKKYNKIAFRVAHNPIHINLIENKWIFFLTSANKSWEKEIKKIEKVYQTFEKDLKNYNIKIFAHTEFIIETPYNYSHIFEFKNNDINYLRK